MRRRNPDGGPAATASQEEYDSRDAEDDAAESAQQMLDDVVDEDEVGGEVDLGPTDPETIEEEYGLDLDDIEHVPVDEVWGDLEHEEVEYPRLAGSSTDVRRAIMKNKYSGDEEMQNAVQTVSDYLKSWKGSSNNDSAATTEAIAKRALGIDRRVRNTGDVNTDDVNEATAQAYRDYARISQGFMKKHMADDDGKVYMERGMASMTNTARFMEQMIANPNADSYDLDGNALANYTPSRDVANGFTETFRLEHKVDVDDVAMAEGMVGKPETGLREGEIHVRGDRQTISRDELTVPDSVSTSVISDDEQLDGTLSVFSDPSSASGDDQRNFTRTMRRWSKKKGWKSRYGPQTEEGRQALRETADKIKQSDSWSTYRKEDALEKMGELLDEPLD